MNTPAHAVLNLLLVPGQRFVAPVATGAIVPDLAMIAFYAVERIRGIPETVIWTERYFDPSWQVVFDLFHSIPLLAGLALACLAIRAERSSALLASMALHSLVDLGVHHDDAHRHFLPVSDWRFASPVSYWDPLHHGRLFLGFELALVIVGCALLWRRFPTPGRRATVLALGATYVGFIGFAIATWTG